MIEIPNQYVKNLYRVALAFLIILSLFFVVKVFSEFKNYKDSSLNYNSITLSGYGEVFAVPDIANVSFNIQKEAKTVKEAQEAVAKIEKAALDSLKANNIEDKDIKTLNASFNPKYEYQQKVCLRGGYCDGGKQVLTGYEAYENISVKVRNVDDVGKIMQELGALGVSDLNGPNFAIDDEDALQAEAREEAINDAQAKAKVLAKSLGVKLGKVMSFSEDGEYPVPAYYVKDMMMEANASVKSAPAILPKGENTISSNVSITYKIR